MPVLDTPVDLSTELVVPGVVAGFRGEVFPVVSVAPGPTHPVDAGAPAQHLAHGAGESTRPFSCGLGSEKKAPIAFAAEIERPQCRASVTAGCVIGAPGFQQQDGGCRGSIWAGNSPRIPMNPSRRQ